ncbi:YybH family protein [Nocardia sp. A7]|uniref:YybH family protein n=1 Tax=Nocardia sp. A7 TaxID=2789274 RepID=UPI00397E586E
MTTIEQTEIHTLFDNYQRALNTSDATLAASLYTADGVFMPTQLPTARGADMHAAYEQVFAAIHLDVEFTIDELVVASPDIAYVLTRSNGTQTVLATGTETTEANREVFVLHRVDGVWKIARYMFNKAA